MTNIKFFLLALSFLLIFTKSYFAQISGGNGFLIGNYVEVGIAGPGGYEGADLGIGTLPGVHWRSDPGNNLLGFVADPTMSGWVNFDGDFFTPGSPENGWGFEAGTALGSNNGYGGVLDIPGSVTNWSNTNGCIQVDWHGDVNTSGVDISFDIIYKLNENELFYTTEVFVTNNAATTLNNFYYYRNIDPDNNEVLSGDYSTTNTIVSQPNPPCSKALVSATQNSPWLSYLGLAAIGDNFRVSYGGFSNRDASNLWDGIGFTNTVGSQNTADEAISLSYLIPTLGPGESKSFKFLIILDAAQADNALNSLFYFDYQGSLGSALPECSPVRDTAITCTSMPISIGIQGDALNDFNWLWTPSTGLSTTTGTDVTAQPSSTITYTITGTPINPCYTTSVTQQIVVVVLLGPDAQYVDPGPQCGDFDLNSLIHSDANNTPGALFNFYSTVPAFAGDTTGIIAPGVISQGDSVWVVYADTARGCFDAQYVDIQWGTGFSLVIDVVDATCGQSNGSTNVSSVVGGTAPYDYQWTAGPNTANYDNIGLGFYTVTVTDDDGCVADSTIQVSELSTLSINIPSFQQVSCNGFSDGSAYVEISGGTGPFTILWDDILTQQTDTAFNLSQGLYSVTVTDDNSCSAIDTIQITEPLPLNIQPVLTNLSCFGECNGEIIAAPSGGTPFITGSSYQYLWNTTPIQTTSIATNLCSGAHIVSVTDANGCTLDSTFTLIQPTQFSYSTASLNASCGAADGWAAVTNLIGGTGTYSYLWDVTAASQSSDTAFNLVPGIYTLIINDVNNCDTTITVTVNNNASFTTSISNIIPTTCKNGADGSAMVTGSDSLATYTYNWITVPVQSTQTASNLTVGIYYVEVTDQFTGCIAVDSVTITEPTVVTIATISPNITICSGQSTTITATATGGSGAGYVYTWDNGLGTGQNQTVTPGANTTTTYQVTAVDSNNCPSDSATVTVTVHPDLSVIASVDDTICPTTSTTISATPTGGDGGPYTYGWTPNTNMTGANTQNPTVTPAVTTTYTITLSDGCSPTVTDQVTISLWNLPQPLATASDTDLCIEPRQSITFYNLTDTTNGMVDTTKVFWNFGDGTPLISQPWDTISHTYNQPGTYIVTMMLYTMLSQGGCPVTDTVISQIDIYELPIADFISTPNITSMFEPEVQFADQSGSTIANWQWDFAGLDSSNSPNPLYIFPDDTNGVYPVKLTVTDNNGCMDTITKFVTITGEYGIYIPNAFTPDFDNKNDMFGPKGFGISSENYHFMIFDRWGEKMFDTNTLYESWDGNYKGTRVQGDTYVWKLSFMDVNMKKHELIGHVTIIQ